MLRKQSRGALFCLEAEKAMGTSAEHMACQGQGHPSRLAGAGWGGGEQKRGRRRVQEPSWEGLDRSCLGFLNSVLYIMMRGPDSSFSIKVTKSDLHFRKLISRIPVMEEIFTC